MQHIAAVHTVLDELGCMAKPRLLVFNKIDLMAPDDIRLLGLRASHPVSIALSSHTRENVGGFLERLRLAHAEHAAARLPARPVAGGLADAARAGGGSEPGLLDA